MEPYTDPELVLLVSLVNGVDFEMGITIAVPGGVVSGKMISYSSWLRKQAGLMKPSNSLGFAPYSDVLIKAAEELELKRREAFEVCQKRTLSLTRIHDS